MELLCVVSPENSAGKVYRLAPLRFGLEAESVAALSPLRMEELLRAIWLQFTPLPFAVPAFLVAERRPEVGSPGQLTVSDA